jgi:hypothetical protein
MREKQLGSAELLLINLPKAVMIYFTGSDNDLARFGWGGKGFDVGISFWSLPTICSLHLN